MRLPLHYAMMKYSTYGFFVCGQNYQTEEEVAEAIINETVFFLGISKSEIKGKKRDPLLVASRKVIAYLIWDNTSLSLDKIGQIMGGRDHSSIIYYRNFIIDRLEIIQQFKTENRLLCYFEGKIFYNKPKKRQS